MSVMPLVSEEAVTETLKTLGSEVCDHFAASCTIRRYPGNLTRQRLRGKHVVESTRAEQKQGWTKNGRLAALAVQALAFASLFALCLW